MRCSVARYGLAICGLLLAAALGHAASQSATGESASPATGSGKMGTLENEFFAAIRDGDAKKFLSYVPERGVNVGARAEHVSRVEVEQQFAQHRGLYCKLFDSSCIQSSTKPGTGPRTCSYQEMLTHSEKVRTAATDVVRGGVHQAILVAEVKNDQCSGVGLIDFIFNEEPSGWKLFSAP